MPVYSEDVSMLDYSYNDMESRATYTKDTDGDLYQTLEIMHTILDQPLLSQRLHHSCNAMCPGIRSLVI